MGEEEISPPSSPEGSPTPETAHKNYVDNTEKNPLLVNECSAFLRAHAGDKIQWRPWGREAIVDAAQTDRLILLSVGFSTSFWCQKQRDEAYCHTEIAALVNERFVPVLADRDEYPDIDRMFMAASQIMGATSGGWPLHVMLTPELKPFFCGHYMPRKNFFVMAREMADMWFSEGRQSLLQLADSTSSQLLSVMEPSDVKVKLDAQLFKAFVNKVRNEYDEISGGFGRPAKFPSVPRLRFLLRMWRRVSDDTLREILRNMVEGSLAGMCCGGLYDHLGGGFFRCSTDVRWQIPQFEKTLYDNAQLALVYAEAAQAFKDVPMYTDVMVETLKFMISKLQAPEGGFYSGLHAVTDGSEGSFYTWRHDELRRRLSEEELASFVEAFGVTEWGNFENGTNHLKLEDAEQGWRVREDSSVYAAITQLRVHRDKRKQPEADDKLVAGWNGLAIHALAMAHRVLRGNTESSAGKQFLEAAQRAAEQLLTMEVEGKLVRIVRAGQPGANEGILEDYAFSIQGLLSLFQEDQDPRWHEAAVRLQQLQDDHFSGLGKRYSLSPLHNSPLPPRQDFLDTDMPSAQSTAISNLLTLNALSLDPSNPDQAGVMLQQAERLLLAVGDAVMKSPLSHASYLIALDQYMDSQTILILTPGAVEANSEAASMLADIGASYFPHAVVVAADAGKLSGALAVLQGKELVDGAASIYVLGSEGNEEFKSVIGGHEDSAMAALHNPSEIRFE